MLWVPLLACPAVQSFLDSGVRRNDGMAPRQFGQKFRHLLYQFLFTRVWSICISSPGLRLLSRIGLNIWMIHGGLQRP